MHNRTKKKDKIAHIVEEISYQVDNVTISFLTHTKDIKLSFLFHLMHQNSATRIDSFHLFLYIFFVIFYMHKNKSEKNGVGVKSIDICMNKNDNEKGKLCRCLCLIRQTLLM